MNEHNYWTKLGRRRLSRRTLLRASARAGVGAAGLMLVGCGDDDDDDDGAQPAAAQAQQQQRQQEQQAPAAQQQTQQEQQAEQVAQQAEQQERQQQTAQQQTVQQQQQQQAQAVQAAPTLPRGGIVRYGAENELIGQSGMDPSTALTQSGLWRALYDPLIATR